jgi:hypothetical protein
VTAALFPAARPTPLAETTSRGCRHAARVAVVKDGVIVGWACVDCPDVEPDNAPEPTGETAMSREKPWVCPICKSSPCVCVEGEFTHWRRVLAFFRLA